MNIPNVSLTTTEALLHALFPTAEDANPPSAEGRRPLRETAPFTITISREVGAEGTTTANEIGKRLGWPVYDQEIINKVAEEMGKPTTQVRGVDERHFNWLEECVANLLAESHVSPAAYLKQLIYTIRALGVNGRCVIVGRAANFILPPETTLRVRLIAELKDRVTVIGRRRGVSDREAAHWIEETEKTRVRFIQGNFGKDPADPLHYDLMLNTSRLTPEECADITIQTLRSVTAQREAPKVDVTLPTPEVIGERSKP